MKLFSRALFAPQTFDVGPPVKLFQKSLFKTQPFDTGEPILRLFHPGIFQTQPFDTGEPIVVPPVVADLIGGGGGGLFLSRLHRDEAFVPSRESILATNNLLLMCAGAFIQTIVPYAEIVYGKDIQDQRHPLFQ